MPKSKIKDQKSKIKSTTQISKLKKTKVGAKKTETKTKKGLSLPVFTLKGGKKGTVSTKTRGQVTGSTRKIYRQKGTGRARHGSIKAPIFVGGGIVFGPSPR